MISCSSVKSYVSVLDDGEPVPLKTIAVDKVDSFIPDEIKGATSNDSIEDFITKNLRLKMPDSIPADSLFSRTDPVFAPIALDTGALLCYRDLALYINDQAWRKYLQTEVKVRKEFEQSFIRGAINAETLYKSAVVESNKNINELYKTYKIERKSKLRWKKATGIMGLILIGYITAQIVE